MITYRFYLNINHWKQIFKNNPIKIYTHKSFPCYFRWNSTESWRLFYGAPKSVWCCVPLQIRLGHRCSDWLKCCFHGCGVLSNARCKLVVITFTPLFQNEADWIFFYYLKMLERGWSCLKYLYTSSKIKFVSDLM